MTPSLQIPRISWSQAVTRPAGARQFRRPSQAARSWCYRAAPGIHRLVGVEANPVEPARGQSEFPLPRLHLGDGEAHRLRGSSTSRSQRPAGDKTAPGTDPDRASRQAVIRDAPFCLAQCVIGILRLIRDLRHVIPPYGTPHPTRKQSAGLIRWAQVIWRDGRGPRRRSSLPGHGREIYDLRDLPAHLVTSGALR